MDVLGLLIFLVVLLGLLAALLGFLLRWLRRRASGREFRLNDRQAWAKRWRELETMLDGNDAADWSVAVIEADKLFDRVMRSMALPGKDMGERLRFLTQSRPELRSVWPAHLVRNRLVHESDYELNRRAAQEALATFKRALNELGVL